VVDGVHHRYGLPLLDPVVQLEVFMVVVVRHLRQPLRIPFGRESYYHVLGAQFCLYLLCFTPNLLSFWPLWARPYLGKVSALVLIDFLLLFLYLS